MKASANSDVELLKPELFRYIGYEPHTGQVLVHESKAPRRVLACGTRWGKSTCAAMEVVAALMEPAESSLGWLVAPTYELCWRVYRTVEDALHARLKHRIEEVSQRDHRIVVRNLGGGVSELRTKSADNPTSLLGEGLDWVVVDEAARLHREIWEGHLSQRLVDRRGWALLLSTPRGRDWFYRAFRRGQNGRDADYESWRSPSWRNPSLDPRALLREKGRLPTEAFDQEYRARFIGEELEPCDVCGGPSPTAPAVVVVEGEADPVRCPECDGIVGDDGRTRAQLGTDGVVRTKVIRLHVDTAEVDCAGDLAEERSQ